MAHFSFVTSHFLTGAAGTNLTGQDHVWVHGERSLYVLRSSGITTGDAVFLQALSPIAEFNNINATGGPEWFNFYQFSGIVSGNANYQTPVYIVSPMARTRAVVSGLGQARYWLSAMRSNT